MRWTEELVESQLHAAHALESRVVGGAEGGSPPGYPVGMMIESDLDKVIARSEQARSWLHWLEPEDAKLVWARIEGAPWKLISWRFAISRATAHRRWCHALAQITQQLNRAASINSEI